MQNWHSPTTLSLSIPWDYKKTSHVPQLLLSFKKLKKFFIFREEISELTLELLALDSGTPRLTGTGTLHVIVEDVNDHTPTFENDFYFLTTEENVDVGTTLEKVHAFDKDDGLNARIR